MKKLWRFSVLLLAAGIMLSPVGSSAAPIWSVQSVNNSAECDYKISETRLNEIWDEYDYDNSREFRIDYGEPVLDLSDVQASDDEYLVAAKSWLIENAVYNRPVYGSGIWGDDDQSAYMSDLWMMLYKAKFGVIESRPVVTVTGQNASFFVAPDVYEVYLQELYRKGIVLRSYLNPNSSFTIGIDDNDQAWQVSRGIVGSGSGVLGASYSGSPGNWSRKAPAYFNGGALDVSDSAEGSEAMTMLQALNIIARFMRFTDKDMTDTEAGIVMYKYGVTYLSGLTAEEQSDVTYLIAKGIIDVEDASFNLYDLRISNADVFKLVYRVANENARFDFSEIQLTDSDSFWQAKGYSADNFELYFVDDRYVNATTSVTKEKRAVSADSRDGLYRLLGIQSANAAKKKETVYKIVKEFDRVNKYFIAGVELTKGLTCDELHAKYSAVTGFKRTTSTAYRDENDKGLPVYRVTFEVAATTKSKALKAVESKIEVRLESGSPNMIYGVTKLMEGNTLTTMISKEVLRKNFSSQIEIVTDKILKNSKSGTLAYLSYDSGYALVGNQVIKGDETFVTQTATDVYYNFDVISSLLGTEISDMFNGAGGTKKIATIKSYDTVQLKHKFTSSKSKYTTSIEYVYANYNESDSGSTGFVLCKSPNQLSTNAAYCYNVNQVSTGINTLWRDFDYDVDGDGVKETVTVLVDWLFKVPEVMTTDYSKTEYAKVLKGTGSSGYTIKGVMETLYTPPEDAVWLEWWNSNIGMSNALANLIFGTENKEYVKCGFLVPQLTIMLPKEYTDEKGNQTDDELAADCATILNALGFKISTTYSDFVLGTNVNWINNYFKNAAGLTTKSLSNFAQRNRRVNVYQETRKTKKGYSVYGGQFVRTAYGILFRNLNSDRERFAYTTNSKNLLEQVCVEDRVGQNYKVPSTGAVLLNQSAYSNDETKDWVYLGTVAIHNQDGIKNGTYVKVAAPFLSARDGRAQWLSSQMDSAMPAFTRDRVTNGFQMYLENDNQDGADLRLLVNYLSKIYEDYFGVDMHSVFENNSDLRTYWTILEYTFGRFDGADGYADSAYYFAYYDSATSSLVPYKSDGSSWSKDNNLLVGPDKLIYTQPVFYLPAGDFYAATGLDSRKSINGVDGVLYAGLTRYVLNQSTVFYSGMLDGMINAQLSKEIGTTEVGSMKDGATLVIGDIVWTKRGDYFTSEPITSTQVVSSAMKKAKDWKKSSKAEPVDLDSEVANLYKEFRIRADGPWTPLKFYLSECTLGESGEITMTGAESCLYADGMEPVLNYYTSNGSSRVSKSISDGFPKNKTATSVVIKMKIDDSMLVVPISADGTAYRYCATAKESLISGDDFNLFDESAFFESKVTDMLDLDVSSYEMTSAYNSMKDKFYDDFHELSVDETVQLIKVWIMVIASWLVVISWLIYWSFTRGGCLRILEIIAGKEIDGKSTGLDLVRIISLGVYNINSPPDFKRTTVVTLVCIGVLLVCLFI